MKSSILKLLVSGMLALYLSACAPYPRAYFPVGGAYSSYGITQGSYYGGYPYRYDNHSYPYSSKYRYEHHHLDRYDGYNPYPSWNSRYVRPKPSHDYRNNHNDRKHQQFGYQGSVPTYPHHNDHNDLHGNNNWSKPPSDRRWDHYSPQVGRPNPEEQNYRQHQRSDDRGNQIKQPRNQGHENDKRGHHENHEPGRDQRESRRRNH